MSRPMVMSETQAPHRPTDPDPRHTQPVGPTPTTPAGPILPVPPTLPARAKTAPAALRRLGGLATALTVLLPMAAVANAYAAFAFFDRASLLGGPLPTFSEITDADDTVASAMAAVLLLQLVVGVVWIVWQYRHARNATRLGHQHQLGPAWAIGGWFIPVANLVLPYRQLMDSARASAGGAHRVLYAWWASIVASVLLIANGFRLHSSDVRTADQMRGAGSAGLAFAAVLAVVVVRVTTNRQRRAIG
jgi:Domain of unknown function (DUF4328)